MSAGKKFGCGETVPLDRPEYDVQWVVRTERLGGSSKVSERDAALGWKRGAWLHAPPFQRSVLIKD